MEKLKGGKVYKIIHHDVEIGRFGHGSNNYIIFAPLHNTEVNRGELIDCAFIITFDRLLRIGHEKITTGFYNDCIFSDVTFQDISLVVDIFKLNGKSKELSLYLRGTNYRYNRKLNKVVEYGIGEKQSI